MGNVLRDNVKLIPAIESYKQALKIKPEYSYPYWNLSGCALDISEAKTWVKKCLEVDAGHVKARLTLATLNFYEGDETEFNNLIISPLWDHHHTRSMSWVISQPELPKLYFNRWQLFDFAIQNSSHSRPFYEFGVWRGAAFRYLIKPFKKGYGFDTFEGLPEDWVTEKAGTYEDWQRDWHSEKAGYYSSDGNIPEIEGGEFFAGKFEDTLPEFFASNRPMASIINFDADLYSSTKCALNYSKPVIDSKTILVFDEFINNPNWEEDEFKALEEFCAENNLTYQVLAVSFFSKQVAIRLLEYD
jgi:hypothetical protein